MMLPMTLWPLIIVVLILQEGTSTGAALLAASQNQYDLLLIHVAFVVTSLSDICIGYAIGRVVRQKIGAGKFTSYVDKWAARVKKAIGKNGERLSLVLFGLLSPAYIGAFLFAWLNIRFGEVIVFVFLGNALWYTIVWLLVTGVGWFVPGLFGGLVAILILTSLALLVVHRFGRALY